jgi:hypothetical protein
MLTRQNSDHSHGNQDKGHRKVTPVESGEKIVMSQEDQMESPNILINEVQLVLAEKRTSLAAMRTGIAVFALPLTVLSVLVATSKYYDFLHVFYLIVPLLGICAGLIFLGAYLILRSIYRIHDYDQLILGIKQKNSCISDFVR